MENLSKIRMTGKEYYNIVVSNPGVLYTCEFDTVRYFDRLNGKFIETLDKTGLSTESAETTPWDERDTFDDCRPVSEQEIEDWKIFQKLG